MYVFLHYIKPIHVLLILGRRQKHRQALNKSKNRLNDISLRTKILIIYCDYKNSTIFLNKSIYLKNLYFISVSVNTGNFKIVQIALMCGTY